LETAEIPELPRNWPTTIVSVVEYRVCRRVLSMNGKENRKRVPGTGLLIRSMAALFRRIASDFMIDTSVSGSFGNRKSLHNNIVKNEKVISKFEKYIAEYAIIRTKGGLLMLLETDKIAV
jgi:hypothetical protein